MNSGGAFRIPGSSRSRMGSQGAPRSTQPTGTSNKPTIMQITLLIVFSCILGILLFYLHNHQSNVATIKNSIMVVSIMIAAIGLASFLNLNINVYDFLISSQINVLCIFLLLCYIGVTSFGSLGTFVSIGEYFWDLISLLWDPTNLFKKGFSIIMPTIFLLIPIIVLVMNLTKNVFTGLLVLVVSTAVVYFLWPEDLTSPPIGGGNEQSLTSRVADTASNALSSIRRVF
jgi:hypothetical protein